MSAKVSPVVADLQILLQEEEYPMPVVTIASDPNYVRLREFLDAIMHSPAMESLSAEELRALNTFIITVTRSATQSPGTARLTIADVWRAAETGVLKLPLGIDVRRIVHALLQGSNA
jgi:hypothetical protein